MKKTSYKKPFYKKIVQNEVFQVTGVVAAILAAIFIPGFLAVHFTKADVHPKYAKGSLINVNNGLGTVRIYDAYSNHSPAAAFYEIRYVVDGVQLEGQIYEFEIVGLAEIR